jgi:GNAT superfamily N-acetyltransferase
MATEIIASYTPRFASDAFADALDARVYRQRKGQFAQAFSDPVNAYLAGAIVARAFLDGHLVGIAILDPAGQSDLAAKARSEGFNIVGEFSCFVLPRARRRGLGAAMAAACEETWRKHLDDGAPVSGVFASGLAVRIAAGAFDRLKVMRLVLKSPEIKAGVVKSALLNNIIQP